MKTIPYIFFIVLLTIIGFFAYYLDNKDRQQNQAIKPIISKSKMKILSPAFQNNQQIPSKYTCDKANINPPLEFSDILQNAKSLVLIVDDPDAPSGTWTHWTLWNIPPTTTKIEEKSVPQEAVEGVTSFGKPGYGGPCPPSGTHHYFFKLYALDTTISLDSKADVKQLVQTISGHIIQEAQLVGLYSR